jgi:hypothetical protein
MSRVVTPPQTPTTQPPRIPHEKIAVRAYEKWVQRGRPHGTDKQDWLEAEAELRAEYARNLGNNPQSFGSPPPAVSNTNPPRR